MNSIAIGALVLLRSGGPVMTVWGSGQLGPDEEGRVMIDTEWFSKGVLHKQRFDVHELVVLGCQSMSTLKRVKEAIAGWRGTYDMPAASEPVTVAGLAAVLEALQPHDVAAWAGEKVEKPAEEMLPVEHPKGTCIMVPVAGLVDALRARGWVVVPPRYASR